MNYDKGYTAAFYAVFIDPDTWTDTERFELLSGSISRSEDGLRQNATLNVRDYDEPIDRYIRIYMEAEQSGDRALVPLFTGIATTPGDEHSDAQVEIHLEAYSPLKDVEDSEKLRIGYYVPAGANGADAIKKLLRYCKAPVEVIGDAPSLSEAIIAEQNETGVTMIERILETINWQMQIRGDGTIVLSDRNAREPVILMAPDEHDIIETSYSHTKDGFECPNVVTCTSSTGEWTETDEDPESELSTVSRGRTIVHLEENVSLADNENLVAYTIRTLKELQARSESYSYSRAYYPGVNVGDLVQFDYPGIEGVYEVESQSVELTHCSKVSENVKRTI